MLEVYCLYLLVFCVFLWWELLMEKIVIIGPSGAGKTTLAKALHRLLRIKAFHMDRFFWKPNWERKDRDTRKELLDKLMMEKQWIIEGSYFRLFESCMEEADTIIFLDIHPVLCFWRIIKRHLECRKHPSRRRDIPEGCTDKLTLSRLLDVLIFRWREGKKLEQDLSNYKLKQIIRLHSSEEVEDFLVQLEQDGGDNKKDFSYKTIRNQRERSLATIG